MKDELKVIKIGGNIIDNEQSLQDFLKVFAKIKGPKLLVHGGGKLATKLSDQLGIKVHMVEGRRITDKDTLDVITMAYAGKINKHIVAGLQAKQCNAVGFTGADGNSIVSVKRPVKTVDYGWVGDVKKVNSNLLKLLLNQNITPVFCAITHNGNGQLLNTNADTIAAELASAFVSDYEVALYYCFEKKGVLKNINDEQSVIEYIDSESYQSLLEQQVIAAGMLPKLTNCFHALQRGVAKVCIGQSEMLTEKAVTFTTITL